MAAPRLLPALALAPSPPPADVWAEADEAAEPATASWLATGWTYARLLPRAAAATVFYFALVLPRRRWGWVWQPAGPGPGAREHTIVPQPDYRSRLAAVTRRAEPGDAIAPPPGRTLAEGSHADWLAHAPFRLILGSGLMGMYEHLGRLQALAALGIWPAEVVGVSSGAIVAALACTGTLADVETALMRLSILDFFDPSARAAWQGNLCAGDRLERALTTTLRASGRTQVEDAATPLAIQVYNGHTGATELIAEGALARAVRRSAALPLLFADDQGYVDGGWVDDQGQLAMAPGRRTLQFRLPTGDHDEPPTAFTRLLRRPPAIYAVSSDPNHLTLLVDVDARLRAPAFLWQLDLDRGRQRRLVDASRQATLAWLVQPCPAPAT